MNNESGIHKIDTADLLTVEIEQVKKVNHNLTFKVFSKNSFP